MFSCFGVRKSRPHDREPLLPRTRDDDDTTLQRELHQKLHSYQMIRALTKGYMPSNDQAIIHLRTVLAADVLNPDNSDLSEAGRLLIKYTKQWLQQLIDLLQHKNSENQVQDFIWYLSKSRISVDVEDARHHLLKAKKKADTRAAYRSLQTAGTLLLTNSDFRLFLSDLNVVFREVFKDTAFTLSGVAEEAGKQLEPSQEEQQKLKKPGADEGSQPSNEELGSEVAEVSQVVTNGAVKVVKTAEESLAEKLSGDEKETLLHRLKQAVLKLRQRRDYSESVSTLSLLLKRYAQTYSKAAEEVLETTREDINENPEADRALKNFYTLIRSFGDPQQWDELENRFHNVMKHSKSDPQFERLMNDVGNSLQKLLTDPEFFDHADETFQELRQKSRQVGSDTSPIHRDIDAFLSQCQKTLQSTLNDKDIALLLKTTKQILKILSPAGSYANNDLVQDSIRVFVPLLIAAIQYIPIPRLEISTPDLDLLLENLIIEPGRTVNNTSFFPYKLRIETHNDVEIRKARFRTTSTLTSQLSLKFDGLSARADEVGFWLRAHSGIFRLADEGIASIRLDERGVDIHVDVEIGRDRLEKVVGLKAVRVQVHKLDYVVQKSKLRWLGWLLKPLLRPILKKVVEKKLAEAIADAIHAVNREVVFARERLRATRISDPADLATFVKAVMARLTPTEDPDLYVRVGMEQPGKGVFKGVYAPGSVVKLWNEEAVRASERIEDYGRDGWRSDIFDAHTGILT